jgi:catechol 2,3-dioxygenase-like lactoylglutathione lyase family enzyme
MVRVTGLDHIVLLVADARRSLAWYRDRLGLEPERLDEWERGEAPFVSVRVDAGTIVDLVEGERTGINVDHLCLVVDVGTLGEGGLDALATSGDFDVLGPPADLFGARGVGRALYVRDPDGNVVELRHY